MKKNIIMLIACTLTYNALMATAEGPELREPLGTSKDCNSLHTDIQAIEKKAQKNPADIKHLNTWKYHFEKHGCAEKLKAKAKK
jgi:hypothetical protein